MYTYIHVFAVCAHMDNTLTSETFFFFDNMLTDETYVLNSSLLENGTHTCVWGGYDEEDR